MPLIVDIAIIVKLLILLAVGAGWLLKKAFEEGRPEKPQPRAAVDQGVQPDKGQGKGPLDLNREIEEFLKRAAQRRAGQARGERAAERSKPKRIARPTEEPLPVLEPVRTEPLGAGVAEHVQKHLATEAFGERAAHLADDVVRSEQELERRLEEKFSHQVGRLADTSRAAADEAASPAGAGAQTTAAPLGLAALLADGHRLRQAIVINEILQRPEHCW